MRHAAVLLVILLGSGPALAAGENLLAGRTPARVELARRADVITDGKAPYEGGFWNSRATARLDGTRASVVWDLGAVRTVTAAWLQADNDDAYRIELSPDGQSFAPLWSAPPADRAGLRSRHATGLSGTGRYVRLTASGGDGSYAVGELQLFEAPPQPFPPQVPRLSPPPFDQVARDRIVVLGLALMLALLVASRAVKASVRIAAFGAAAVAGAYLAGALADAWPVDTRVVALVRGTIAAVALVAILRETFAPPKFPADRRAVLGVLGLCGVASVIAFYNLAQPQFYDFEEGSPTFVHYWDLRQYYTTVKYYRELGYRGIYEADLGAYAELTGKSLDELARTPVRDLQGDYSLITAGEMRQGIEARRARFSPERWAEYKRDIDFFRRAMGERNWVETLHDFGGNATPLWMSITYLMWNGPPSRAVFRFGIFLDLGLLLLAFAAVGRAFGARTMLVAMILFGANDFIMYGTNWSGATLRHDWLAYLMLAAASLKLGRLATGGALLAAATLIRAFPALIVAATAMPVVWWVIEQRRATGRVPALRAVAAAHRDLLRVYAGGIVAALVLVALSSALMGPSSWIEWYGKASQLTATPHPADIGLRNLVAGGFEDQPSIMARRLPVFLGGIAVIVALAFVAARGAAPWRAMLLGVPLVPTIMNTANYYSHLVCLLPLLAAGRDEGKGPARPLDAGVWAVLLGMCVVQYFTELVPDLTLHFYLNSAILMVTLGALLTLLARDKAIASGWLGRP